IEHGGIHGKRRTANGQQSAAFACGAVLARVVLAPARDAAKPLAHTGRAPWRSIAAMRTSTSPIFMAAAQRSAAAFSAMAKIVGPDPLIEQPNAPAWSAARLMSSKCGISGARRGSA